MASDPPPLAKTIGRGTSSEPPNRFEAVRVEADWEQLERTDDLIEPRKLPTAFLPDQTRGIIRENDSPDIPFRYGINVYRGCEHGCAYCYARPYHEYLGMNAGLDFETKIVVKYDAPELLRAELCRPSWRGELIAMSGVTDCYQPAERRFRLTRGCLLVCEEAGQALGMITKNALIRRDLDVLSRMAARRLVHVFLSITTLDAELARVMEPRTSAPQARLRTISALREAGVPVGIMVAPLIPGLNDHHMADVMRAAADAGALSAGFTLLRLPYAVRPIFEAWLKEHRPLQAERVLARIRDTRGGQLNDARFGKRMRGEGLYAQQIAATCAVFRRQFGLEGPLPPLNLDEFRPPRDAAGQGTLF